MAALPRPQTVCIIGAGPSGLVAAKTLTTDYPDGTFKVTIFEAENRIGGLWPLTPEGSSGDLVNPSMCTNQSRHTIAFSDLAWPDDAPSFPKAWQVGQYLERYAEKYTGYEIRTGCRVLRADPPPDYADPPRWTVTVRETVGPDSVEPATETPPYTYNRRESTGRRQSLGSGFRTRSYEFDKVLVATGFFGQPKIPRVSGDFDPPVWHSSKVRDLHEILTEKGTRSPAKGRKILVLGGQMSGVEAAANAAMALSSAINSPEESKIANAEEYTVHHLVQRPFWVMPLMFPVKPEIDGKANLAPSILPLDLVWYDLAGRPSGPIENTSGHISRAAATVSHNLLSSFIGSDQSETNTPEILMQGEARSSPPWLGISDTYTEFVRSGNIKVERGKAMGISGNKTNSVIIQRDDKEFELEDIAAVIFATGFETAPSLSFLPVHLLQRFRFDPSFDAMPLHLNVHATVNKKFPSLGFVGFYRSPYWGVIEMGARYLGQLWSGDERAAKALAEDQTLDAMLALRRDPRKAQFPMGDYTYLMESFASILGIKRTEPAGTEPDARTGVVLPPRYLSQNATPDQVAEAARAVSIVDASIAESLKGRFVAKAVFRGLQGNWNVERTLTSRIATYPSGKFKGIAKFLPRTPTAPGVDLEYLYVEDGDFVTEQGMMFRATRRYAYRYQEITDTLSAWFIKVSERPSSARRNSITTSTVDETRSAGDAAVREGKEVDYLFHELEILPRAGAAAEKKADSDSTTPVPSPSGWKARAHHLCINDTYDVDYEFQFRGAVINTWTLAYTVTGPEKDYGIESTYVR